MTGIQGIQPVTPVTAVVIADPGAPPAVIHGGPAEAAHSAAYWENGLPPYPWVYQPGVAVPAWTQSGFESGPEPAVLPGQADPYGYADPTATGSHGAPWPSFGTADGAVDDRDSAAWQQSWSFDAHGLDTGQPAAFNEQAPEYVLKMRWADEVSYVTPGMTGLVPVPAQLMANPKTGRDRVQGYGAQNEYGFDSAHVDRPRAVGNIPGDHLWLDGAQRPMTIEGAGRQAWQYPTGPESYFAGQVPGTGSVDGAVLSGLPAAYNPPPEPPAAPAYGAQAAAPVWSAW